MFRSAPLLILASATLLNSVVLQAQAKRSTQIEEVIVTAQKRAESLQDTPISIAAFSGDQLERLGIDDLGDLAGLAPNVDITPFPNSRSSLVVFMRGVGNNDSQTTQDPSVGVYLDGVYVGRSVGLAGDVADIERIEVLRGPQGTLYGRNTTGGAINMISRKPAGEAGARLVLSTGNRDYGKQQLQLDSPEWGGFAASLTAMTSEKGGWVDNIAAGEPDFSEEDKTALRLATRWDTSETLSLRYAYDQSNFDGPQNYYQPLFVNEAVISQTQQDDPSTFAVLDSSGVYDHFRNVANDKRSSKGAFTYPVRDSTTDIKGHTLIVDWELPFAQLKLTAAQRDLEEFITQDYAAGFQANEPVYSGGFFDVEVTIEHEQRSLELQLLGDINEQMNYVAGIYYYEEEGLEDEFDITFVVAGSTSPVLEDRDIRSENEATAIYGQLNWQTPLLNERLALIFGARYSTDKRYAKKRSVLFTNSPNNTLEDSESYSSFNPAITVNIDWNDQINTYAKLVTGYKSGGFNVRSTEQGFSPAFDQENMVSAEVGAKLTLLNSRLRVNAAIYRSEYDDIQIQQITDNATIFLTDVFNAGKTEVNGFELDILAIPLEGLSVSLSYGLTRADFVNYTDQVPGSPTFGENLADQATVPYAPEQTWTAGFDYQFPWYALGELRLSVDYAWRDERFGTALNADMEGFFLDDYGVLNARLSLSEVDLGFGQLGIALWGKNIDKEDYLVHQISFGFARTGVWNEPATYGLDLSLRF